MYMKSNHCLNVVMSEIQIQEQDDTVNIVVVSIEPDVCKQFQEAAFQKYKQAVLNYGSVHPRHPEPTIQKNQMLSAI